MYTLKETRVMTRPGYKKVVVTTRTEKTEKKIIFFLDNRLIPAPKK